MTEDQNTIKKHNQKVLLPLNEHGHILNKQQF